MKTAEIKIMMSKPLWQLTCEEFCELTQYANACSTTKSQPSVHITGVRCLAEYLGCSESTVFMLRRNGVLNDAIISQVGKRIVFDGEKARTLAASFQNEQRLARKERHSAD